MLMKAFWRVLIVTIVTVLVEASAILAAVEIKYFGSWNFDPWREIEKTVIDRFNKEYEGKIHVTFMSVPGAGGQDASKLITTVTAGNPPDVAKVDRFQVGSLASQGVLQPLDDLIKRDKVDLGQFFPPTVQEAKYRGKMYAIP